MSGKQSYIDLSKSEELTLRQGSKYPSKHEFGERCQGLLLSNKGWSIQQLAEYFEGVPPTVGWWFTDWESNGLVGLMRQSGQGRKTILGLDNQVHTQALAQAVNQYYQHLGRIKAELQTQLQLEMSNDTVKRFLKKSCLLPPPAQNDPNWARSISLSE